MHVKLEDMQAYGDQLLKHALMNQQCMLSPVLQVASLSVSAPPLSPPNTDSPYSFPPPTRVSLKRKRDINDNDNDQQQMKRSECLLDQAIVPSVLYKKLHGNINHYHLDTLVSSYTHDC